MFTAVFTNSLCAKRLVCKNYCLKLKIVSEFGIRLMPVQKFIIRPKKGREVYEGKRLKVRAKQRN